MILRVKYFQSWREADLEFAPFTIIVGPSNSGKTALVRALEAVLFNTKGTDFITRGAKQCQVELELANGDLIKYVKDSSVKYNIKGKEYSAIGRGPFKEVESLGFQELTAETVKIRPQISRQHDAPFLISQSYTPTVVGSILNSLSEASQAQIAKRMVEKDTKVLTSRIKYKEEDLEDTEGKAAKKKDWEDVSQIYGGLVKSKEQLDKQTTMADAVDATLLDLKQIKTEITTLEQKKQACDQILPDTDFGEQILLLQTKKSTLEDVEKALSMSKILHQTMELLKNILKYVGDNFSKVKIFLSEAEEKVETIEKIEGLQQLNSELSDLKAKQKEVDSLQFTINQQLTEFEKCNECGRYL